MPVERLIILEDMVSPEVREQMDNWMRIRSTIIDQNKALLILPVFGPPFWSVDSYGNDISTYAEQL